MKITDEKVFDAVEAYDREVRCWRLIPLPYMIPDTPQDQSVMAVRDRLPVGPISFSSEAVCTDKTAIEQMEFRSTPKAKEYVQWRGMKAALESVTK